MTTVQQTNYRSYKDLVVYQRSLDQTLKLTRLYSNKKLDWLSQYLVRQLIRACASIGANLAEGYGRMHKKDYRRFVGIARGSSFEVNYWLDLIIKLRPTENNFLLEVQDINTEIMKMLTGLMKSLEK